ncbi:hypothetical protein NN561_008399 [Cricetulus griseus]
MTCSACWTTTRSWPCETPSGCLVQPVDRQVCQRSLGKQSPNLKEAAEPVTKTEDIQLFQQQAKEDKEAEKVDFRSLGKEFCQWFFELLNSQNPFLGPPQDEWCPQNFWNDIKLRF